MIVSTVVEKKGRLFQHVFRVIDMLIVFSYAYAAAVAVASVMRVLPIYLVKRITKAE